MVLEPWVDFVTEPPMADGGRPVEDVVEAFEAVLEPIDFAVCRLLSE